MPNQFSNFVTSLRSRGVLETARNIYIGFLKVNSFLVFHLDLRKPQPASEPVEGITLRLASIEELCALRQGMKDLPFEFFCDKTFGFTHPFLAFVNGELAAIHWLVMPGEFSRFLTLGRGDVELNYNTVLPAYRGKRLAQLLMTYVVKWAKDQGNDRMFGIVHVVNIPQFKPMLDMGFRPVETLTHFAVFRPKATLKYVKL